MAGILFLSLALGAGADPLDAPAPEDFPQFLRQCVRDLVALDEGFNATWGLPKGASYNYDLDTGVVTFTSKKPGDKKKLVGVVQVVGTFDDDKQTWVWAWADKSVPKETAKDSLQVKAYGAKYHLDRLTTGELKANGMEAQQMGALQAKLLGADLVVAEPIDSDHPKVMRIMVVRNLKPADE